jgi:hypothetical protein
VGLPWIRLDTNIVSNPKIAAMIKKERDGRGSALVYLFSLAHAGGHGTDGFISEDVLSLIHGRQVDADRLVKYGLWHVDVGGWLIHDWGEKQPSTAETQAKRKRAQDAANARWGKRGQA